MLDKWFLILVEKEDETFLLILDDFQFDGDFLTLSDQYHSHDD